MGFELLEGFARSLCRQLNEVDWKKSLLNAG